MTTAGNHFLIHDSHDVDDSSDIGDSRVLVFATRWNLDILASSEVWYLDVTFKVIVRFSMIYDYEPVHF